MRIVKGATVLALAFASVLSGCSVRPEPFAAGDRRDQALADLGAAYDAQEPIRGPITLEEAMARAVKYNLDYRQKLMETAVASGELDVARFDMLPQLAASAGYDARTTPEASRSRTIDGDLGDSYSTSQDLHQRSADITASWNLLDFGVSYIRARQYGDRVLIAQERRKRVLQTLINDVRAAYWRLVGAQRLMAETDSLAARVEQALARVDRVQQQKLSSTAEILAVRRELLTTLRHLTNQRELLRLAKAELSSLMNLRPGTEFEVEIPSIEALRPQPLSIRVEQLEEAALALRPELAEENYQARLTRSEATAAILSILPGIRLTASGNYDSNSYALYDTWAEAGARVSYNLMSLLSLPTTLEANEAKQALDRTRRLAFSVAVITQVNLAHQAYLSALKDLTLAAEIDGIEQVGLRDTHNQFQVRSASELAVIQAEIRAMSARLALFQAYANLQAALGRVYSSVGVAPLTDEDLGADLATMGATLRNFLTQPIERQLPNMESQT